MPIPWLNEHKSTAAMNYFLSNKDNVIRDRRGRDRMIVGFTTTCVINVYRH